MHSLKVTLRSVKPPVWRRIEVESDVALDELSHIIELAMGWLGYHLHAFEADGVTYEQAGHFEGFDRGAREESDYRLSDLLTEVGTAMRWDYDFGDGWEHDIKVEAISPADCNVTYPRCVAGRRACPPEDCGGPWGYQDILDAIGDKGHPRHRELTDWLPPGWDPTHFDPNETSKYMLEPQPTSDDWW